MRSNLVSARLTLAEQKIRVKQDSDATEETNSESDDESESDDSSEYSGSSTTTGQTHLKAHGKAVATAASELQQIDDIADFDQPIQGPSSTQETLDPVEKPPTSRKRKADSIIDDVHFETLKSKHRVHKKPSSTPKTDIHNRRGSKEDPVELPSTPSSSETEAHMAEKDAFEQEMDDLRLILRHGGPKYVVSHEATDQALTAISKHIKQAIGHLMSAKSFSTLTTGDMKQDLCELCKALVSGIDAKDIRERFAILPANGVVTPALLLQALAWTAIVQWAFLEFDSRLPSLEQHGLFESLQNVMKGTPQLHKRIVGVMQFDYLETHVEPTFAELSHEFTRRLADMIANVAVTNTRNSDSRLDVTTHLEHFQSWEKNMSTAFTLALQLRLSLACSPLQYNYSVPALGQAFSSDKMKAIAADRGEGEGTEERTVWLCLRPMIESWNEKMEVGSRVVVARALLILN